MNATSLPSLRRSDALDPSAPDTAEGGAVGLRLRALCSACRQVFGIPDYERYVEHRAERHPGGPLLTRRQFCDEKIARKYGQGGMRCC